MKVRNTVEIGVREFEDVNFRKKEYLWQISYI